MHVPFQRQFAEDKRRPRKMARARYNLRRPPPVRLHDPRSVARILDRFPRRRFHEDCRLRHSLRMRSSRHYLRFDKVIGHPRSGNNEPRRYSPLIFMNCFRHARQLGGSWISIAIRRIAKHNDGVKPCKRRVRRRSEITRNHRPYN